MGLGEEERGGESEAVSCFVSDRVSQSLILTTPHLLYHNHNNRIVLAMLACSNRLVQQIQVIIIHP